MGTGETPAAKAVRLHPEVSPVLLGHHVCGDFASAKKGVLRIVNPHLLRDAIVVLSVCVIPPPLQFLQRKLVRGITIHLVGRHKYKNGVSTVLPRGLQ